MRDELLKQNLVQAFHLLKCSRAVWSRRRVSGLLFPPEVCPPAAIVPECVVRNIAVLISDSGYTRQAQTCNEYIGCREPRNCRIACAESALVVRYR